MSLVFHFPEQEQHSPRRKAFAYFATINDGMLDLGNDLLKNLSTNDAIHNPPKRHEYATSGRHSPLRNQIPPLKAMSLQDAEQSKGRQSEPTARQQPKAHAPLLPPEYP